MMTNFPVQPPNASLGRSKTALQSQNTATNQIIPRWSRTKVIVDFQVSSWLRQMDAVSSKESGSFQFLCCSHFLCSVRLWVQFLSQRRRQTCESWAEERRGDKWSAESGQEPVAREDLSEPSPANKTFSKTCSTNLFSLNKSRSCRKIFRTSSCLKAKLCFSKICSSKNFFLLQTRAGRGERFVKTSCCLGSLVQAKLISSFVSLNFQL